ncbi:hypothetical protein [Phaeovulum sp.]
MRGDILGLERRRRWGDEEIFLMLASGKGISSVVMARIIGVS